MLAVLAFVAGVLLVATTVLSAIMTLVVQRALPVAKIGRASCRERV